MIATRQKFTADWLEKDYDGYTFGEYWNGWSCPYFTKEQGLALLPEWNGTLENEHITFDEAQDTFLIATGDPEWPFDQYKGQDIETVDGPQHVYPIGSFGYCWDDAKSGRLEDTMGKFSVIDHDGYEATITHRGSARRLTMATSFGMTCTLTERGDLYQATEGAAVVLVVDQGGFWVYRDLEDYEAEGGVYISCYQS